MNLNTTREQVEAKILSYVQDAGLLSADDFPESDRFRSALKTMVRGVALAVYLFIDVFLRKEYRATWPRTSEKDDVKEHLIRNGLEYRDAVAAQYSVRLGTGTAVAQSVPIGQGSIVGTEDGEIRYRTLQPITITPSTPADARGKFTLPVTVEALTPGTIGNVIAESINTVFSAPQGVDTVYNESAASVAGQEEETIAEARERIRIAENISAQGAYLPDWYRTEVLAYSYCKRAVFRSARELGREGEVLLLVRGATGALTEPQKLELANHFLQPELDTGAATHVLIDDLGATAVDKTVTIAFQTAGDIPDQSVLNSIAEAYFLSLSEGEPFEDTALRAQYLSLQGAVSVVFAPVGDISTPIGSVVEQGPSWEVVGVVD